MSDSLNAETIRTIKTTLASTGIKYLVPSYVDMHGIPKTKIVPVAFFDKMIRGSELFTGAALDGVPQDVSDEEVCAHPDPNSFTIIPWRKDSAWFASDLWNKGKPFEACSRNILKRVLKKAEDMGFKVNCGIEAEFYVFNESTENELDPVSTRHDLKKPAYDMVRLMDNLDSWLAETVDAMNELGWEVYSFDHEDGVGQFELDFNYSDALTTSDRFTFLRVMINEYARKNNCFASWMPKPFHDKAGSGAHFNVSLKSIQTGENLFKATSDDEYDLGLSKLGYQFAAGIMNHLSAIQALSAPTVNSYKRLIMKGSTSGYTWAPCFTSWGGNNRTNTLRIPSEGGRVELRSADSACNPYLGLAMMIAAGLEGIENQLSPPKPNACNLYEKTEDERTNMGIHWLPRDLNESIEALIKDPLSKAVLGEAMFDSWIENKNQEWFEFNTHVSHWEQQRYLKMF